MVEWEDVINVMISQDFVRYRGGWDRRPLIRMANDMGGPKFLLVPASTLEELEKIPHSSEGHAVDALEALSNVERGPGACEIFFFSHRWLRADHPDEEDDAKARVLVEFVKWRRAWVLRHHGFDPILFFWIDWACVDQADPGPGMTKLPLYIACCERVLTYSTDDYETRAWCRMEQLLLSIFAFSDHQVVVKKGYTNSWPNTGVLKQHDLTDPRDGNLSVEQDRVIIAALVDVCNKLTNKAKRLSIVGLLDALRNTNKQSSPGPLFGENKALKAFHL